MILVAIVGVLATACAPGMIFGPDFVLFTPKAAPIVDRADCLTPDIYTGLTGLGPWPSADIAPAPELGHPPDDFDPVSVVRCELAQNPAGNTTVDAVSLAGDVAAVVEAFSIESRRYPDNVSLAAPSVWIRLLGCGWSTPEVAQSGRPGRRSRAVFGRSPLMRSDRCTRSVGSLSTPGSRSPCPAIAPSDRAEDFTSTMPH
ncbi:hypothetical protein [Williamsia muralis]|uniref:hypothetical protein n=1 Tax=Williamsia marianensis TaxID=85044 RepID=UPI003809A8C7